MANVHDMNDLPLDALWTELVTASAMYRLIDTAMAEDLGEAGDITSQLSIEAERVGRATVRSRANGVLAGARLLGPIAKRYDQLLTVRALSADGSKLQAGQRIATVEGPLRALLAAERVMLNFLTHLSGIASLTAAYVEHTAGTDAKIYDTRKTIPGWRALAKYAVRCGGGYCHRLGLHDAVLIKDNHIAHLTTGDLHERVASVVRKADDLPRRPQFIEVEVDTIDQLRQVIGTGVGVVLLDNFSVDQLREAVALRNEQARNVQLEASGGVNLATVAEIAATGVDRIAVGAINHSAPALDIGFDIDD
jgi:nicotinate-nucleotide pyrophosphorylase (carboxylating)